jgi:ATP-dependent Lhr-like helicase
MPTHAGKPSGAVTLAGTVGVVDNLYVAFRGQAAASEAEIREAIADLCREARPNGADAMRLAENCARGRLSKFQKCLPPRLESAFLAEALTDVEAARLAITGGATPAP